MKEIGGLLAGNKYPGRGIVIGASGGGDEIFCAYFIMGRSENSRNRVFVEKDGAVFTRAYDESKVTDPSLIIYAPVISLNNTLIVTNGDQTDTVAEYLKRGETFESALETRTYEPDSPNFTPRISAVIEKNGAASSYKMSILKRGANSETVRLFWTYGVGTASEGRFIHTYERDGDPLPPFDGEPEAVMLKGDFNAFTNEIWENLNAENKISLFTCSINLKTGAEETRIINKHI